jgi:hypothetical protein
VRTSAPDAGDRVVKAALALLLLLLAASVAHADDDNHVVPCRPTLACTADLAPTGTLELELGYQPRRVDDGPVYQHTFPFLFKVPVASWLELQLGGNGYTIVPGAHYFGDLLPAVKVHLLDQTDDRPSLAVSLIGGVPSFSQAGYTRIYDLFAQLHASKDNGKLHLDGIAGLGAWQLEGPVKYQPYVAVAATYPLSKRVAASLEPHYYADAAPIAPHDGGAMLAVAFAIRPWLVVDGALDVVLFADQTSEIGLFGISIAPVRLWQ